MDEEIRKEPIVPEEIEDPCPQPPAILEEITMEEMAVDGICGIY